MKYWKVWLWVLAGLSVVVGIYLADFYFERWVHYKMSYQSLVEKTVREMVKPECRVE